MFEFYKLKVESDKQRAEALVEWTAFGGDGIANR